MLKGVFPEGEEDLVGLECLRGAVVMPLVVTRMIKDQLPDAIRPLRANTSKASGIVGALLQRRDGASDA
ncbi:hypothetical protein ABIE58_002824 [Roseovarius sp. MBR-78]|jgi:hypothetical protein|uniref:hypothetical protein n=1 Tax=Roseovarius sp. MBR-78 TaxID=3156460 RepID=UPI00339AC815